MIKRRLFLTAFVCLTFCAIAVGVVIACATGFLAIKFMMKLIKRVSLAWFAFYMVLLGLVYLLAQTNGLSFVPPFQPPVSTPLP